MESVLAQTYPNFEYIVVDNLSTDRSAQIARDFAKGDKRIKVVINQVHVNADANHNLALAEISTGSQYCKFIQGDDKLFPNCVSQMVALAEKFPKVGIVACYGITESGQILCEGLAKEISVVAGPQICRERFLGGPYVFGNPSSTLIRSEIVRESKEFYPEWNTHSDTEICYRILENWDFGFVHAPLVFKRSDEKSLSSWSRRMNTYAIGHLQDLITYGPKFLSRQELKSALSERFKFYYNFLAKSVLENRDEEFWNYHRSALIQLGHPLNSVRLYFLVIKKLLRL